ncbi:MAG: flavodoxin [Anaerolineae bacterium]
MSTLKSLVIYYSLEDSTRLVAEAIATEIGADVVGLRPDVEPRATGFARYILYGWQRMTHPRMHIAPLGVDPQSYDLVYIGTPVWASRPAPAVQTLLRTTSLAGQRVALFCTHKGGPGETLALMEKALTGATVVGRLEVANVQVDTASACERAAAWAREVATTSMTRTGAETP